MSPRMHAILSPLVCIEAAKEGSGPCTDPCVIAGLSPHWRAGVQLTWGWGKEPSCLKVISCDCKGWGRGSLGGQGASWELVSPYTALRMPLLPETQAQANKRFSVCFWWWLSFEVYLEMQWQQDKPLALTKLSLSC